jgi:predicted nucleic acid-binding protein
MGSLIVPSSGLVYLDANSVIYSVEKHPVYWPLLEPLWRAAKGKTVELVSSDLVLMETLVAPLKSGDTGLVNAYESLFQQAQTRLFPVTQPILREAARLRATTKLKTPDAVHAATARHASCVLFVSNDGGFRAVPGLPLVILDDLLKP